MGVKITRFSLIQLRIFVVFLKTRFLNVELLVVSCLRMHMYGFYSVFDRLFQEEVIIT